MKALNFTYLLIVLTTVYSCKWFQNKGNASILANNNMDFPNLKKTSFKGINFYLSTMFTNDSKANYIMKKNSLSKSIKDLDVYFSIEAFSEQEALKIQSNFNEPIDALNAVNDQYILKREKSVYNPYLSIKKNIPKKNKYSGYIQAVQGSSTKESPTTSYFISTIKVNDQFYVFQLIGIQKNMGYLYDDFIDLLSSVKKIK